MITKGEFPKPFSLGGNRTAWLDEDIDAWLAMKAGRPIPKPGVTPLKPLA